MITIPGKIPITLHPIFFLVAGLIGWISSQEASATFVWMGVIFFSVLVHELGHALTAMLFGQRAAIAFVAMGGLTTRKGKPLSLPKEFFVVLNGPLFGLTLFLITNFIQTNWANPPAIAGVAMQVSIFVNLVWSILNLFPVGPLDGSRLLSIALEGLMGSKGIRLAHLVGVVIGISLGLFGFFVGGIFFGLIFMMLGFESFRSFQDTRGMTEQDRDTRLQEMFREAQQLREQDPEKAKQLLRELRRVTERGLLYTASAEVLAQILSDEGEFEEAYSMLHPLEKDLSPHSMRLLHRLAYFMRDHETVARIGDTCFQMDRSYETAFINAIAHATQGKARPAIGWLQQAHQEGLDNVQNAVKRKEFDAIRDQSEFQEFLGSVDE